MALSSTKLGSAFSICSLLFSASVLSSENQKVESFASSAGVAPVVASQNKKVIGLITESGRLMFLSDVDGDWSVDYPAEAAGHGELRFAEKPTVLARGSGSSVTAIYAVTTEGRLVEVVDDQGWRLEFPAERAGYEGLFRGTPAGFVTNSAARKKSLYVVTREGWLAQVWDSHGWQLDFPLELARSTTRLRLESSPSVFPTNRAANKKTVVAVTSDGRLIEVWDGRVWQVEFPAEAAGYPALRFDGTPAVFATNEAKREHSIYVVTKRGRLAQLWNSVGWQLDFPAEKASGGQDLLFTGSPSVMGRDVTVNKKSIFAMTNDGRLVELWDTHRWQLAFPAEAAGYTELRFSGSPAVVGVDPSKNRKSIYAVATDGVLAEIRNLDSWNLVFPLQQPGANDSKHRP